MKYKEWTVYKEGIYYSSSLSKKEFCFGASSGNPHGEWGTSCLLEEFVHGKHHGFVQNYFPDKMNEILEYAKRLLGEKAEE